MQNRLLLLLMLLLSYNLILISIVRVRSVSLRIPNRESRVVLRTTEIATVPWRGCVLLSSSSLGKGKKGTPQS